MSELISAIIFAFSLIGIGLLIFIKIPVLGNITPGFSLTKESVFSKLNRRIKQAPVFKNFSYELFLQKILAKIRIVILKTENLILNWIQKLRESHKQKNDFRVGDYWYKIRKEIKNRAQTKSGRGDG